MVQAIITQAQTLVTCQEMFYNDRRAALLARLGGLLPGDLNRIFLCNSGTEAVEGALKFARLSTGRAGVVATMRGFHGRTLGALSATHKSQYRQPFEPLVPGSTFGGNPLACAAALATLDVLADEHLVERAAGQGAYFRDRMRALGTIFGLLASKCRDDHSGLPAFLDGGRQRYFAFFLCTFPTAAVDGIDPRQY